MGGWLVNTLVHRSCTLGSGPGQRSLCYICSGQKLYPDKRQRVTVVVVTVVSRQ